MGCQSAREAYDAMYGAMFNLVISDVMMPGEDGFEFAENVRALNQEISVWQSVDFVNTLKK